MTSTLTFRAIHFAALAVASVACGYAIGGQEWGTAAADLGIACWLGWQQLHWD
jgi:hypothetical protein